MNLLKFLKLLCLVLVDKQHHVTLDYSRFNCLNTDRVKLCSVYLKMYQYWVQTALTCLNKGAVVSYWQKYVHFVLVNNWFVMNNWPSLHDHSC